MKLAIQSAIDELRSLHPENNVARVLRQKKAIADWLEEEYMNLEIYNMIVAMQAVYMKCQQKDTFDIEEFIKNYLKEHLKDE